MKAILKGISSIDLPGGEPSLPDDPIDCWIVVDAEVGPEGQDGADVFTFYVCTLKRLAKILERSSIQVGRGLLLVTKFDWETVRREVCNIVGGLEGETWPEVAGQLNQYGYWEFEDYEEMDGEIGDRAQR